MGDRTIACVFGARRTGTNYLEALLETNFGSEVCVSNLNREQTPQLAKRPHLFEACGSKHEFADRPFETKFASSHLNIFIIRAPRSWLEARIRYAIDYLGQTPGQITTAVLGKWISQEYVGFYSGVAERWPDIANAGVITYEDLLHDFGAALGHLASGLGLPDRELINLETRVKPAGGLGGGVFKPAAPNTEFAVQIEAALDAAQLSALAGVFYDRNDPGSVLPVSDA